MAETIWSFIAITGTIVTIGVIVWFLISGRGDRDRDEAARRYYDEHGYWPDEPG